MQGIEAAAKVYEPVECIGVSEPNGLDVITLPWKQVAGAQVLVLVRDNYASALPAAVLNSTAYWPTLEVTIWGAVQGYSTCLKRQHVRMLTGPLLYRVESDEFYSAFSVRARDITGGYPGGFGAGSFSIKCQVMLAAHEGIGKGY